MAKRDFPGLGLRGEAKLSMRTTVRQQARHFLAAGESRRTLRGLTTRGCAFRSQRQCGVRRDEKVLHNVRNFLLFLETNSSPYIPRHASRLLSWRRRGTLQISISNHACRISPRIPYHALYSTLSGTTLPKSPAAVRLPRRRLSSQDARSPEDALRVGSLKKNMMAVATARKAPATMNGRPIHAPPHSIPTLRLSAKSGPAISAPVISMNEYSELRMPM